MDLSSHEEHFRSMEALYVSTEPQADVLTLSDSNNSNKAIGDADLIESPMGNDAGGVNTGQEEQVELSPGGVLDEETITRGLSNLGRSANGCYQVYLDITIPGFSLTDITLLSEYKHLQKVEIPYNDLTDLSPLGQLKYLLILDVSHNRIETLLDFDPPFNLQEVNMSFNNIQTMCDLSEYPFLKKLLLDNNSITRICGLENCKQLKYLSLSHNKITTITGLTDLPIQYLNLSSNEIKYIENIESLKFLKELNLSRNCIRSLSGLDINTMLESLDMESNEVIDVTEIKHLRNANHLQELNLLHNPVQELPDYRLCILYKISRLTMLDRHHVKEQEKVLAINMYNPPMEVVAARDHITNVVYSFLQPTKVWDSTLPSIKTPYPMLVLVGPQGAGKRHLCAKLVKEFSDYFGHGISHTTRKPHLEDVQGKDYHFVSLERFEKDIRKGAFIQTCMYQDWYGLQMKSVEKVAREGLACVVHMELEGVLSLKKTYFEPRYVLIMPLNSELHEKRLRGRRIYMDHQILTILKRTDMYITQNQNHPGFFDAMVSSDDMNDAYTQLRQLVMDYLGISSISQASSTAFSRSSTDHESIEQAPLFTNRTLSNLIRAGTWSRSETFSLIQGPRATSIAHSRGTVEEESFKKQFRAAKDIITGHMLPLSKQLLFRHHSAAAGTVENQEFGRENREMRSHSAPVWQDTFFGEDRLPDSPDSSSETHSEPSLTDSNSSPQLGADMTDTVNRNVNFFNDLPMDKISPLAKVDDHNGLQSGSETHLPENITELYSNPVISRPGSDRHAVLPPIQNITA